MTSSNVSSPRVAAASSGAASISKATAAAMSQVRQTSGWTSPSQPSGAPPTETAALRDLAVVVPSETPAAEGRAAVLGGGGELLHAADVFDSYEGTQLGEGRKSLALSLEFRAPDRTLTDEEVSGRRAEIEAALGEIGGQLRG